MSANCEGCGHSLARHIKNVLNQTICLCVESGISSGGVIMPYTMVCDCIDGSSKRVRMREAKERREREEWKKDFEERFGKTIRKISSVDELFKEAKA